jgi:glutaredoxin 3
MSTRRQPLPPAAQVTIYTKPRCIHCLRAKRRLRGKGATFHEIPAGHDIAQTRRDLSERFGQHTFPQIIIGERHIGGAAELAQLDRAGQLDQLLAAGKR